MPDRKPKSERKNRLSAHAALISVLILASLLAWRYAVAAEVKDIPPTLTWRVAGDADLL